MKFKIMTITIFLLLVFCSGSGGMIPKGTHLFILSGQSNMVHLDVDAYFTPIVAEEFEEDNIIVVKYAVGGSPIRNWYDNGTRGLEYIALMNKIRSAISGKNINSITLVWMQGESDSYSERYVHYKFNLTEFFKQLESDLGMELGFVIGRIGIAGLYDHDTFPYWKQIRDIQTEKASSSDRILLVNTDDLGTDIHFYGYYDILGKRFAEAAINLNQH